MNSITRGKKYGGFTVIESLALVTLLGLAATLVLPRFSNYSERAKMEAVKHHLAQLNQLAERHFVDEGVWPSDLSELVADGYLDAVPEHPDAIGDYQLNATTHRVEVSAED